MNRRIGVRLLGVVGPTLLTTSPVLAQQTDGAFRLSLDGILYAGEFGTMVAPSDPELGDVELETTTTNAGLYAGSFGVGLAYAFSPNGVIGARLLHSSGTTNLSGDGVPAATSTRLTLLPYGEYVVTVSPTVQPFFSGSIGLQSGSSESGDVETSNSAFVFGLSAGLHLFPTDTFSIDPYFAFYRATGSGKLGAIEVDYGSNTVLLGFSLSGWIGGDGGVTREPAETLESAEPVPDARSYEVPAEHDPEPEPQPVAAEAKLTLEEDGGVLSGAVALGSGQLTLLGRPTADADNIVVRIAVSGRESTLKDCSTGALITGGSRYALRDMTGRLREHGSSTIVVLQGKVGSRELSAFTEGDDARIVLCGRMFAVHAAQRQAIGEYFEQFKSRAMTANTWSTDAPATSAEQPPASESKTPLPPSPPASTPAPPKSAPNAPKKATETPATPAPKGSNPPAGSFDAP